MMPFCAIGLFFGSVYKNLGAVNVLILSISIKYFYNFILLYFPAILIGLIYIIMHLRILRYHY